MKINLLFLFLSNVKNLIEKTLLIIHIKFTELTELQDCSQNI